MYYEMITVMCFLWLQFALGSLAQAGHGGGATLAENLLHNKMPKSSKASLKHFCGKLKGSMSKRALFLFFFVSGFCSGRVCEVGRLDGYYSLHLRGLS